MGGGMDEGGERETVFLAENDGSHTWPRREGGREGKGVSWVIAPFQEKKIVRLVN